MKGKSGIITLIVLAVAIKAMTYIGGGQINSADPGGSFSGMVSGFLGIADIIFYGLVVLIIILIPYSLSKRGKKPKAPGKSAFKD